MTARRILSAASSATALLVLAGCSSTPTTDPLPRSKAPAAVAVVTGDANSPLPAEDPTITHLFERAIAGSAEVAVVDAGGRPRLFSARLGTDAANPDARSAAKASEQQALAGVLTRVVPALPQSDPWAAFTAAVGWVKGQGGGTVVVANSGLGTAGFLDYLDKGLLEAEPADLVTFAKAHGELPDAAGVTVVLYGIGWAAAPQPALTAPERANLVAQWQALASAAGATVHTDPTPITGPGPSGDPHVSTVGIQDTSWKPPPGTCGTALDSDSVHFRVGTATFTDPAAATTALRQVVTALEASHEIATVTGTTSSEGGDAINYPLSKARAEAVAQLMVGKLGLPVRQIGAVRGDASHFPGFIPDTGPRGTLLPGPAAEDRQTIVSWPCASGGST